jgi:crotonobetainyl-CoA:carnitine CoA-transferase CaiB-like acyl-CoA transferase
MTTSVQEQLSAESAASGLLAGVRVLDLTRFLGGPLATQFLADLGAEVIKVEGYPRGDFTRGIEPFESFASLNRNKRSIHVDFNHPEGREVVHRLARTCDAFVEVSNPGWTATVGLDYEHVKTLRPSIVYCSITAFGQSGPYRNVPGHGFNMEAYAGLIAVEEDEQGPRIERASYDIVGSSLTGACAAVAMVSGILRARTTGEGCFIDMSIYDTAITALPVTSTLEALGLVDLSGFAGPGSPKYAPYRTADGKYLMVGVIEHKYWSRFCEVIGRTDLIDAYEDSHLDDWGYRRPDLYSQIASALAAEPLAHWEPLFNAAMIPVTPIHDRGSALTTDHAKSRGIFRDGSALLPSRYPASPFVVDGVRGRETDFVAALGQHTGELLAAIGYSADEISKLMAEDVVRGPETD